MPNRVPATSRGPALDAHQRETFLADGVLRLPGLIPRTAADAMAERLWASLANQHGMERGRPQTWTKARPAQFRELRRAGAFAPMLSADLTILLDDIFTEGGWTAAGTGGGPLVTFPPLDGSIGASAWTVPAASWHLDILPGQTLAPWPNQLRIFTFLAPLEPGGGGTVYLSGSHRVVTQMMAQGRETGRGRSDIRSAAIVETLRRENPWIAELCTTGQDAGRVDRFMRAGATVRGADLRVGEMTGEAGDVFLMHPAVIHAPAPNHRTTPRLMLAMTVDARR